MNDEDTKRCEEAWRWFIQDCPKHTVISDAFVYMSHKWGEDIQEKLDEYFAVPYEPTGIADAEPTKPVELVRSVRPLIYLSSPYTADDPAVRQQRYRAACDIASMFMRSGELVFSPICHWHGILQSWGTMNAKPGPEHWEPFCRTMLSISKELRVVRLVGWKESTGVQREVSLARELGIPIEYV